ncbi:MAG: TSUP family transporter [Alphaproteobacteria bacterium]|nr:TSUP family transporter [Alphaproteobacteria bacterium]
MLTTPEMFMLAALLVGVGLFGGVLSGLLGVGGGIVIVPALYHVFSYLDIDLSLRMHMAVGTSLATIIPTSIRSVRSHHKRGAVDTALLRQWAIPLFIGVLIGTVIAVFVAKGGALTFIFATVALLVAAQMAFVPHTWTLRSSVPGGVGGALPPVGIGAISAMMGIGGGTLAVPTLSAFGVPIHRAVATAAGFGLIIAVPGAIGFIAGGWNDPVPAYSLGYVSLLGFALIVPATLLAVPWGVALAHRLKPQPLRWAFALFLALTSLRMYWDLFGH